MEGGKPMDCALWLNRRKVRTAAEIAGNPDIASLRGYFLAGSLIGWLYEHGGKHYAQKLEKLSPDDPQLNEKLSEIFGGASSGHKSFGGGTSKAACTGSPVMTSGVLPCSLSGSLQSVFNSFIGLYGALGSFTRTREFSYGSFLSGSLISGSGMHEWEWEWLYNLYKSGSFMLGSYASFHEWEWERLFRFIRSGSFTGGSYGFGSFRLLCFFGSGICRGSFGSLSAEIPELPEALDEYDRIMLETLIKCPLDRFGYGIHNI